MEENIENGKLT